MSTRSVFTLPTGQIITVKGDRSLSMPDGRVLTAEHPSEKKSKRSRKAEFEKMRKKVQETLRKNKEIQNARNS